jgi:hypothetical protein
LIRSDPPDACVFDIDPRDLYDMLGMQEVRPVGVAEHCVSSGADDDDSHLERSPDDAERYGRADRAWPARLDGG